VKPSEANEGGNDVFTVHELDMLRCFVEADPTVMLDEVVYHMYSHTGKFVDIGTMCRTLHAMNFSHKLVKERMLRGSQCAAGLGLQETAFQSLSRRGMRSEKASPSNY
jgi:hypothetical protein